MRLPTGTWSSYGNTALCYLHIHEYFSFRFTFQRLNVTLLASEALGTLMLVLVIIYQFCSQFILFFSCKLTTSGTNNIIITSRWAKCYIMFISSVLLTINLNDKRVWAMYYDALLPNIFKWA